MEIVRGKKLGFLPASRHREIGKFRKGGAEIQVKDLVKLNMTQLIWTSCGLDKDKAPTLIYEYNAACVSQMKEGYVKSDRTKHIPPKFFEYIRELIETHQVEIKYVQSSNNAVDLFTKSLPTAIFRKHVHGIEMRYVNNIIYALDSGKDSWVVDRVAVNWESSLCRQPRGGREESQYRELMGELQRERLWTWDRNGENCYTVASGRAMIELKVLAMESVATRCSRLVPAKVNVFAWRLSLNRLPTMVNLDNRGIDVGSVLCHLCDCDVETTLNNFKSKVEMGRLYYFEVKQNRFNGGSVKKKRRPLELEPLDERQEKKEQRPVARRCQTRQENAKEGNAALGAGRSPETNGGSGVAPLTVSQGVENSCESKLPAIKQVTGTIGRACQNEPSTLTGPTQSYLEAGKIRRLSVSNINIDNQESENLIKLYNFKNMINKKVEF
ncbi:hypothetical protein LXL04_008273 [Taraxacum kok-saghyz]